jgi:Carboxypeptidase regulatory-like domain
VSAVTGDTGRFAFAGLPPGKYDLTGQRRGLLAASWPGAIVTGPGQDTENIVLRLSPPAIISGKVVDDAGEPVGQALVQLFGSRIVDGRRQLIEEAVKRTGDTGEYRFSALPPGSYYLVVSGVPWYTKFNETHGEEAPRAMTHAGYGIRYYPNATDPAAAEPLVLKAGQEAAANFTLLPVPAVSVFVHCEQDESLTKQYTLTAAGLLGKPVNVRQGSETGDLYNLWGILPGHYTLRAEATDGSHTWHGATELDIAGSDADVDVTLHEAPSLSGMVVVQGGGHLPAQLTVLLSNETGRSVALAMGADGRFSTPAIPPGRYRVSIGGADDYYLRHEGELLDIQPGAAVRLSLPISRGAGRIAGTVDRGGQPLPGALVVLTPANRAVVSNSDGAYEFHGLPAGEYALFAVEDGSDLEYANPGAIGPYLAKARKIQIPPDVAHVLLHTAPAPAGISQLK